MKISSFKHYDLKSSKKRQLVVDKFLGVNYSTQKFQIADGHAIDLKNFVYKNGVIQKRHGIEQLLQIKDFSYTPSDFSNPSKPLEYVVHSNEHEKELNGLWSFEAEDGETHVVAHIGRLLYEIKNISNDYIEANPFTNGEEVVNGETHKLAFEYENFKSFAFVGGKKLWFLGGNKYMCLRFFNDGARTFSSLFAVEDSDYTPVPTTTMSITCLNTQVNQRQSYEKVNLLTEWRKNKMITGLPKVEDENTRTQFFEYTLDAPLILKKKSDTAKILFTLQEQGICDYGYQIKKL